MVRKILLYSLCAFLLAGIAQSIFFRFKRDQDEKNKWVQYGIGLDDSVVFYDTTHMAITGDIAYVVTRTDYPEPRDISAGYSSLGQYTRLVTTLKINCKDNTVDEGVAKYYDGQKRASFLGKLVSGPEYIEGFIIDPGTNISKLESIACKVKKHG
jgi:hypothetical protein